MDYQNDHIHYMAGLKDIRAKGYKHHKSICQDEENKC